MNNNLNPNPKISVMAKDEDTTFTPDPRETRLPHWAQDELRRLRGENLSLRVSVEHCLSGNPSDIRATMPGLPNDVTVYLPPGTQVDFNGIEINLNDRGEIDVCMMRRGRLYVRPLAANHITIQGS